MKNLAAILTISLVLGLAGKAGAAPVLVLVPLEGLRETPELGDPEGIDTAFLAIAPDVSVVNRDIAMGNIDFSLSAAHIQKAPARLTDSIIVGFDNRLHGTDLTDPALAAALASPMNYAVNLRNRIFLSDAAREPFVTPIPDPSALSLVVIGLASLGLSRRRCRSI